MKFCQMMGPSMGDPGVSWCLFKRTNSGKVQERFGRDSGGMDYISSIQESGDTPNR